MVCILKGCIAPSWTLAREMMSSMTFKLELVLMDATRIKPSLIRKVIKILNSYHKYLTPNVSFNMIVFYFRTLQKSMKEQAFYWPGL